MFDVEIKTSSKQFLGGGEGGGEGGGGLVHGISS